MFSRHIYISGHTGMVGSAVMCRLKELGAEHLITASRANLDLRDQAATHDFFATHRPDIVVFAAGRVGGIHANTTYPAEFMYDNLAIVTNAIHASYLHEVGRFLFLGSTCIYPRDCPQPMQEHSLLTSPLEATHEAYALAKIAGLKLCQYYRQQYGVLFHSAMPANLYGPGDNYHLENSHVLPALLRRFHDAKESGQREVVIWGTGTPRREFLHVDDLADAIIHLLQLPSPPDWVNVGTGKDITIRDLAELIAEIVGFDGRVTCDTSAADGTPVKRSDSTLLASTGWQAQIGLRDGIERTYQCFLQERATGTLREGEAPAEPERDRT